MSLPICAACSAELPADLVTLEPHAADGERCFRCDRSAAHDVVLLRLPQDVIDNLRVDIGACENESIDITSGTLGDVLPDRVPDDTMFGEVLLRLVEGHDFDAIEWPDFTCHGCGAELENWWTDVRTGTFVQLVDRLPDPPPEITELPTRPLAERIEWWRSDASPYLVHLTRGDVVAVGLDTIADIEHQTKLSASEMLWAILSSRRLKASAAVGMKAPAVCFTEKPLPALKDTILGNEARTRKKSRSKQWTAYGVMFTKEYLRELGARPVLHVNQREWAALPKELQAYALRHDERANWTHEREWRLAQDLVFDLARCIVLVPTFDQANAFRTALDARGLTVMGILPLLDVFAAV
jgi:hypothetical protein